MRSCKIILLVGILLTVSHSQTCEFETFHDLAYTGVSITSMTILNYWLLKAGVEERNRRIIAPMLSSFLIIGQRIYDNETGKNHDLRYISLAGGILVSIGFMVAF